MAAAKMVPIGEEFAIESATRSLIAATGCQPYVAERFGVDLTKARHRCRYRHQRSYVFTCGDMLVVWALREGRDAAAEVNKT